MEVKVIDRIELEGVPSASGIEFMRDHYYVIGDNSPWLYLLDKNFKLENIYVIGSLDSLENGLVPKAIKKDLEAMCGFLDGQDSVVLIFGSGSKSPIRDHAKLIRFNGEIPIVSQYDIFDFYLHIKDKARIDSDAFNIEAAAVLDDRLYLFNRGDNKIIECSLKKFMSYLKMKVQADEVKLKISKLNLPEIDGIEAGFSGATSDEVHNRIFVTASVENTANWIDDGQVLGSFVGLIEPDKLSDHYKPSFTLLKKEEDAIPVKVESIALISSKEESAKCVLVTDSDGGVSELFEILISFH